MSERQYNDEEVAAIFERASEMEHTALPVPGERKGLTLAAIQDIGREVGISPESISLAARSLDHAGRPAMQRFMGLPIGVGRQALVEPTPSGHRLRLQTVKGDSRALMTGGVVAIGGATATLIAVAVAGGLGNPGTVTGIGFMALMGLGMFTAGALRVSGWARRRRAQIEEVIARLGERS